MGYKIWDRVYGIKGGQDNFSFSRSKFLRHSKNCRVIPNIFEMFSWAPTDVFTAAAVSAEVVIVLKSLWQGFRHFYYKGHVMGHA